MLELTDSIHPHTYVDTIESVKLFTVPNVSTITTKPPLYNKLYITKCPLHRPPLFVIDVGMIPAFGHWVFESAIYIPIYLRLKRIYPDMKLMVGEHKTYKSIFARYYGVHSDDILYSIPPGSLCTIPSPITSLTHGHICERHRRLIQGISVLNDSKHKYEYTLFPRQTENYPGNNTSISYVPIIDYIDRVGITYSVYNTSTVMDFSEQLSKIQSSRVIIIPDGSSFLVNGFYASNSTMYVVGRLCSEEQSMLFPQIEYIKNLILSRNKVYWFKSCTEFIEFLKTGIYVEPTFKYRNRSLESWW
jgi:hypothetical protein